MRFLNTWMFSFVAWTRVLSKHFSSGSTNVWYWNTLMKSLLEKVSRIFDTVNLAVWFLLPGRENLCIATKNSYRTQLYEIEKWFIFNV